MGFLPFKISLYKPFASIAVSILIIELLMLMNRLPLYQITFIIYVIMLWAFYLIGLFLFKFDEEDIFVIKKVNTRFPIIGKVFPERYR